MEGIRHMNSSLKVKIGQENDFVATVKMKNVKTTSVKSLA